jgi:DNA-binding MarR family transcriptional regulator
VAEDPIWYEDVAFPALLRAARAVYRAAIGDALSKAGFDDVPRNGAYVLGGIARTGAPLGEIVRGLGVSKQAAGQLVDTLVLRGYLDRSVDAGDRRRLTVTLTERGSAATTAIRSAVDKVDADMVRRVGHDYVAHARATLASLVDDGGAPAPP